MKTSTLRNLQHRYSISDKSVLEIFTLHVTPNLVFITLHQFRIGICNVNLHLYFYKANRYSPRDFSISSHVLVTWLTSYHINTYSWYFTSNLLIRINAYLMTTKVQSYKLEHTMIEICSSVVCISYFYLSEFTYTYILQHYWNAFTIIIKTFDRFNPNLNPAIIIITGTLLSLLLIWTFIEKGVVHLTIKILNVIFFIWKFNIYTIFPVI